MPKKNVNKTGIGTPVEAVDVTVLAEFGSAGRAGDVTVDGVRGSGTVRTGIRGSERVGTGERGTATAATASGGDPRDETRGAGGRRTRTAAAVRAAPVVLRVFPTRRPWAWADSSGAWARSRPSAAGRPR